MYRVTLKRGYDRVCLKCQYLKDVKAMVDTIIPCLEPGTEFIVEREAEDDSTDDAER